MLQNNASRAVGTVARKLLFVSSEGKLRMQIKNILFPTDFSERARAIVPHVRAACERFDARLTLLHTIFVPTSCSGLPEAPGGFEFPFEAMMERATGSLK